MKKYEILLVDDDVMLINSFRSVFENEGYQVTTASSGEAAVAELDKRNFDLVVTDLVMEAIDGIGVLKKAKENNPLTTVIILTGYGDLKSSIDSLRLDADDYLLKPCETEELLYRVSRCLDKLELNRKIKIYETVLPVCCVCKKIRDDEGKEPGTGEWMIMEEYLTRRGKLDITHSYCPDCEKKAYEDINKSCET